MRVSRRSALIADETGIERLAEASRVLVTELPDARPSHVQMSCHRHSWHCTSHNRMQVPADPPAAQLAQAKACTTVLGVGQGGLARLADITRLTSPDIS
jgi:hypothetical protein